MQYKIQEAFEDMMGNLGGIPIYCAISCEAHYGVADNNEKAIEKILKEEDPETVGQHKTEPIPAFQAAAKGVAK